MSSFALPDFGSNQTSNISTAQIKSDNDGLTQDALAEQQAIFQKTGIVPNIASKIKEDNERERLAIDQEMNVLTSGNFDPSQELDDNRLEFDMAGSKSLNAKRQKFLEEYPNGTLTPISLSNGDVKLIYKKEPNDPFRFVNRGVNNPEIARAILSGELIGGLIGTRGGSIGVGMGTAGGSLIETGVEKLRGFETQSLGDEIKEAALEGLVAGGLDLATRKLFSAFRTIKNRGNLKVLDIQDWADEVATFAEKEALEPLVKGNVVKTPIWQSLFAQTQVTSPASVNVFNKQIIALQKKFGSMGDNFDPSAFTKEELSLLIKAQGDDLVTRLFNSTDVDAPLAREWLETGQNFQQGLKNWKINTRTLRNDLYNQAINLADDVTFDITPIQNVSKEIADIVRARGVQGRPQTINTGLLDDFGNPIIREVPGETGSVALKKLPKEVEDVLNIINQMDPQVSMYQGFNPITQLKELRTTVFALQQSDDALTSSFGNKLYSAIREVMESPQSGNSNFLNTYQKASQFNAWREGILNLSVIKKSLKSDSVEDIIKSKFNITQPAEVSYIKQVLDKPTFNMLKQSYLKDLVSSKSSLNKFLNNEEQYADVVSKIFSATEVKAIKEFAEAQAKLNSSKIAKIVKQDVSNAEAAFALIDEGYDVFKNTINKAGGKNSKYAQSLKAGIFKKLLDDATITSETGGINSLDVKQLVAGLNKIKNNKALSELLFSPEELLRLERFNLYSSAINVSDDVGGAMVKGQQAAGLKSVTNAAAKIRVANLYLSNAIYAKILTQPYKAGDKTLINQASTSETSENVVRWLTLGINSLNTNITKEEKQTDTRLQNLNN